MSSPPDFLGFALSQIAAQNRAREEAQRNQMERDRMELNQQRYEKSQQDQAFGNALELIKAGRDPEAVFNLYGDRLRYGDLKFLKAEAKSIQQQSEIAANTPKGTEMADVSAGLGGMAALEPDPLRAAVGMIGAVQQLPYPEEVKNRLLQRGMLLARKKAASAETQRGLMETQSQITEARQTRMLGKREALKKSKAEKVKPIPNDVQAAYQMYRASGQDYKTWVAFNQGQLPASLLAAAARHPAFTPDVPQAPTNLGTYSPFGLPEGPFTPVPGMLSPAPSQEPVSTPAPVTPVAPTTESAPAGPSELERVYGAATARRLGALGRGLSSTFSPVFGPLKGSPGGKKAPKTPEKARSKYGIVEKISD